MRAEWRRRAVYVERTLLIVAIVALGWYFTARGIAFFYQQQQQHQLEALRQANRGEPKKGTDVHLPPATSPTRTSRIARSLIGRIQVPRLRLSAIVREGVDDRTLDLAVGHVPETPLPGEGGNVAFAGHRDTFFRPLKQVRTGDRIVVTTPDRDFEYIVRETRVVPPSDVSVLDPTSEPTLTLVTCYPFNFVGNAPNRFIVRAEQVEPAAMVKIDAPAVIARPSLMPVSAAAPAVPQPATVAVTARANVAAVSKRQPMPRNKAARKPTPKPKAKEQKKKPKRDGWRLVFRVR